MNPKLIELMEKMIRLGEMQSNIDKNQKKDLLTNDIKRYMSEILNRRIVEDMDLIEKKGIIEEELKKYICSKLKKVKGISEEEEIREMGIPWYVNRFYNKLCENFQISRQERKFAIDNFILFLIKIISELQGCELEWYILEDESLIEKTFVDYKNGYINRFITHEKTSSIKSFEKIWETFQKLS